MALGCTECPPPPLYTDSSLSNSIRDDIGTISPASGNRLGEALDGFDTPSLVGLGIQHLISMMALLQQYKMPSRPIMDIIQ